MAKFSAVAKGTRARKPIKLPLPGAQVDPKTGEWSGPTELLHVAPLGEDQYDLVLERAHRFAKERGVEDPKPNNPLYDRGLMLHTLALACIDHESPDTAPAPYFDGGWEQIHTSPNLSPETIGYLYLQQQIWQDEINPLRSDIDPTTFAAAAIKTAGGDMSFFVDSRPGVQWNFMRTLASQLVGLLALNSSSSRPSSDMTKTSENAEPKSSKNDAPPSSQNEE